MLSALLAIAAPTLAATRQQRRSARIEHPPSYVLAVPLGVIEPQYESYRRYAGRLLTTLTGQLQALLAAEQAGDLTAAQTAWLPAHASWLAIGEDDRAYGAFGALGNAIDGTTAGLPGGLSSPDFTGFHRIEYELWERQDTAAAASATVQLERSVARIERLGVGHYLPLTTGAIGAWILRCHEILEDADRDTLTAEDDDGSGTGAATVIADVAATREMLNVLGPDIRMRAPKLLGAARGLLAAVVAAARATRVTGGSGADAGSGGWVAIASLPRSQRQALDAAVGAALERLAPISDLIRVAGGSA